MTKKSREIDIESIKVNPFLSMMYFKLSFNAWRKRTRRNELLRQRGENPSMRRLTSEDESSLRSEETYKMEIVDSYEEDYEDDIMVEDRSKDINGDKINIPNYSANLKRSD